MALTAAAAAASALSFGLAPAGAGAGAAGAAGGGGGGGAAAAAAAVDAASMASMREFWMRAIMDHAPMHDLHVLGLGVPIVAERYSRGMHN